MQTKKQIYYARTYRHLEFNYKGCLIFCLCFVLPLTVLMFLYYDRCTWLMCGIVGRVLEKSGLGSEQLLQASFIPSLGPTYYLSAQTTMPDARLVLGNIVFVLAAAWVLSQRKLKGKPFSIYLNIMLLVHMMACVFFLLGADVFPYETVDYSRLYVQQQVGIWITFLVLIGLVEGFLGRGIVLQRAGTVLLLMVYSFAFATVRYGVFLWILNRFSILYMPVMFFALGPFFDFLYFVMIYSMSANQMIKRYEVKRRNEWKWA